METTKVLGRVGAVLLATGFLFFEPIQLFASESRPDIVEAVQKTAVKDCGCGMCASKGCGPCHGKNCYFCVAKALVAKDCGCKSCSPKGCQMCGPGCDVCKFHLALSETKK